MNHGNELPKVIDKSQADIDAAIAAIKASEIQGSTKDFAISCIKLAVWERARNNFRNLFTYHLISIGEIM